MSQKQISHDKYMKYILKYWPILLILFAFIAGRFSSPDVSKELQIKFEQERQRDREAISGLLKKITALSSESRTIREQMTLDSLKYSDALERNKQAYQSLKKKYYEINLSRANAHDLDSLVSRLYPD